MTPDFRLPSFELSGKCPRCGIECRQEAFPVLKTIRPDVSLEDLRRSRDPYNPNKSIGLGLFADFFEYKERTVCRCSACGGYSYWVKGKAVWPKPVGIPASEHMPEAVKKPYNEAQKVLDDSPWAACILLRIALERLCDHLGGTGSNLFKRIESLSLNASEQVIWDAIRKAGNAAAHENADRLFEYRDNMKPNIAITLSKLINQIVEEALQNPHL